MSVLSMLLAISMAAHAAPAGLTVGAADPVVATLDGKVVVTEADIADFQAARACYGGDAQVVRQAAFLRMLESAIAEAAMRAHHGPAFGEKEIDAESARIDRETKAPEILKCIKAHFAKTPERYRRVFVKPALVESRFRTFIKENAQAQAPARKKAERILGSAKKGKSLAALAKEYHLSYSTAEYSASVPAGEDPQSSIQTDFVRKFLKDLAPGQLPVKPIESEFDFKAVRLLEKDGWKYRFEAVSVPKRAQEDWLSTIPKMKLAVHDWALDAWLKTLKGNPRLLAVH